MLHFALTTVTELNDSFSQVKGEGQWIRPHLEETNEILLQLRALIKSEDQFECTKEIVLGCWCVNEWRCCSRKLQCVHTSAVTLYSAAFDRFFCAYSSRKN